MSCERKEQSEPSCDASASAKTKLKPQPKTHFHHPDLDNADFLHNRGAHVHHREKLPEPNKKHNSVVFSKTRGLKHSFASVKTST